MSARPGVAPALQLPQDSEQQSPSGATGDTGARAGPGSRGAGPEAGASRESPRKGGHPPGGFLQHRRRAGTRSAAAPSRHGFRACSPRRVSAAPLPAPPAPTAEPRPETEQVNRGKEMVAGGMGQGCRPWGRLAEEKHGHAHSRPWAWCGEPERTVPARSLRRARLTFTPTHGLFPAAGPLHLLFPPLGLPPLSPLCDTKSYSP